MMIDDSLLQRRKKRVGWKRGKDSTKVQKVRGSRKGSQTKAILVGWWAVSGRLKVGCSFAAEKTRQ